MWFKNIISVIVLCQWLGMKNTLLLHHRTIKIKKICQTSELY